MNIEEIKALMNSLAEELTREMIQADQDAITHKDNLIRNMYHCGKSTAYCNTRDKIQKAICKLHEVK